MCQKIVIEIVDKVATCLTKKALICGNSNYVVDFVFDEEWDKHEIKTAVFKVNGECIKKVFSGSECPIPVMQNTIVVTVGVFAGTIDDNTLSTSTPALVRCKPCATDGECAPLPPPDDTYNQIVEMCEEAVGAAKDVKERADNGEFNGEPGKSSYQYAVDGGYEGSEADFTDVILRTLDAIETTEENAAISQEAAENTLRATHAAQYSAENASASARNANESAERASEALGEIDAKISSCEQYANNTFANALKGKKTGGAITANGVSPIEHELKIKAESNGDITDITTANVIKYGGNLLDIENREVVSFGANSNTTKRSFTGNGIILGFSYNNYYMKAYHKSFEKHKNGFSYACRESFHPYGVGFDFKASPNTTYVAYFDGITNSSSYISEYDKDGNFLRGIYSSGWEGSARKLTTKENTAWIVVSFQNQPSALDEVVDYNNVYIGVDTFDGFEEYKEPTIHPISADGTVEGVTSIYPTTTLMSDTEGIVLNVEYNRDINKAFEELTQAIVSLGGNV